MTEVAAVHLTESTVWVHRRGRTRALAAGVRLEDGVLAVGGFDESEQHTVESCPIRFVDDPALLVGSALVPIPEVFSALLRGALTEAGGAVPLDTVVLTVPGGWATRRRQVLVAAGRTVAREVRLVAVADAVTRAVGHAASSTVGRTCGMVIEVDSLTSVATVGPGTDRIAFGECGSRDILECDSAAVNFMARLDSWRACPPDWVAVAGDSVGDRLSTELRRRWGSGLPVFEPTGADIVRAAHHWGASATTTARRAWRGTAAAAVVTAAIGAALAAWQWSSPSPEGDGPVPVEAAAPVRIVSGRAQMALPQGWHERTAPTSGDRAEIVRDDGRPARILLVHKELNQGAGLDAVESTLGARIAERAGTFTGLRRVEVDAGPALSYEERPDPDSLVRWLVVLDDGLQTSLGCQALEADMADVETACGEALRSLHVTAR